MLQNRMHKDSRQHLAILHGNQTQGSVSAPFQNYEMLRVNCRCLQLQRARGVVATQPDQFMCAEALAPSQRHAYTHNGRLIYEWDQTLTEVNLYIQVPAGVRAKNLAIDIKAAHLNVGIKGNPPYLDLDFAGRVKPADSFWTLEDSTVSLQLCKAEKGQPWTAALAGHDVDPVKQQEEQQRLMLERFQQEHPGFDFSGAKFSGQAPNPRTFMGGMTEQ